MIKNIIIYNRSCITCNKIEEEMVKIGAFIMCKECWEKEFGLMVENDPQYESSPDFEIESEAGKKYKKLIKTYLDKQ